MERSVERSIARRLIRTTVQQLAPAGFHLGKPTFAVRAAPLVAHFVHFHKYGGFPAFRLHLGVRVLNDEFSAIALNGPAYNVPGEFTEDKTVQSDFAALMSSFCRDVAVPWFDLWTSPEALLQSPVTPLDAFEQNALVDALAGRSILANVAHSEQQLSLRKSRRQ